eukprot:1673370-Pyramimonas_sp.AAC.1
MEAVRRIKSHQEEDPTVDEEEISEGPKGNERRDPSAPTNPAGTTERSRVRAMQTSPLPLLLLLVGFIARHLP